MSSVPNEILLDVLLPLDRGTLDDVQFTGRRFLRLIEERMSDVCLRQIAYANFRAPNENNDMDGTSIITMDGRPVRRTTHRDTAHLFSDFVQALRSSRVTRMELDGLAFTPELVELVPQTAIVTDALFFVAGSFADLTPAQFQELLIRFSPTSLNITGCSIRAGQLTDELLRALSKNRVLRAKFPYMAPVDGGTYHLTDDAVVDFCVQEDVHSDEEGGDLEVYKGSFTQDLFKRLVEASAVSKRTQPLRIVVSPLRFAEEDLRDFAQHLSYRQRGTPGQQRIYNFPGVQQGADAAAMDTQIVLRLGSGFQLIRARRPDDLFTESDE